MKKNFKNSILAFLFVLVAAPLAQADAVKEFSSPQQAVNALSKALQSPDMSQSLGALFGSDNSDLWNSGDAVEDRRTKELFQKRLAEGQKITYVDKKHAILFAGLSGWSFPIPLERKGKNWIFDTKIGREEILNRRVGANELDAIQGAKDYVRAQKEYAALNHGKYAGKFLSDAGQKNGLYWVSTGPQDQSPISVKVLEAKAEGYQGKPAQGDALLYHGYYYRILKPRGKGFAMIAYPAKWNDSGVMTFQVNQEGQVLQKNLGKDSIQIASTMKAYQVDSSWKNAN